MTETPTFAADHLLGDGFQVAPLGPATLIRSTVAPAPTRGVLLHVHGYNDYFFQRHLAEAFTAAGYLFYAVDLRAAGRSLLPEQVPHFVTDLRQQAADISAASSYLRTAHPDLPLIVHAHSTGGLTASLWAHAHRHAAGPLRGPDALLLNSPFLEQRGPRVARAVTSPVLTRMGPMRPLTELSHRPSYYVQGLLSPAGGGWAFDHSLKRPEGQPIRAGWLVAVTRAQERVSRGLALACPVLLAAAAESSKEGPDNPLVHTTDSVLDVRQIVSRAPLLSRHTEVLRITDGVHDLCLSGLPARTVYLEAVLAWLDAQPQVTGH
ncbi:MAG: alpha/beta hydrolase [Promicromonosporaceae bacterium]|nr:alpha/beta hydrolase [Promicromonosporaceae bacterium]